MLSRAITSLGLVASFVTLLLLCMWFSQTFFATFSRFMSVDYTSLAWDAPSQLQNNAGDEFNRTAKLLYDSRDELLSGVDKVYVTSQAGVSKSLPFRYWLYPITIQDFSSLTELDHYLVEVGLSENEVVVVVVEYGELTHDQVQMVVAANNLDLQILRGSPATPDGAYLLKKSETQDVR